ncbi:hypothetical protein [Massilia rubra]|uniref:Uncharacterized protein n=1 Tax=Massilia rubra TaxID=2607910 RepID=A0ABX0LNZ6_9BURK|nr:hypothetical protein [Massilia rubra]NHZ34540.1 hypothetical protein [Massilia rubra]
MKILIVPTLLALCALQTMSGCGERARPLEHPQRTATVAKPSAQAIGTARMLDDRSIVLNLRAETEGSVGHARFTYQPGDPMHVKIGEHVGGLKPGEEKSVPPFPEQ